MGSEQEARILPHYPSVITVQLDLLRLSVASLAGLSRVPAYTCVVTQVMEKSSNRYLPAHNTPIAFSNGHDSKLPAPMDWQSRIDDSLPRHSTSASQMRLD